MDSDGHPGTGHGHYYRLPWALALIGRRGEAALVLSWIERNALTHDGDLRPGPPRAGFERRWSSYPLANLATGAWHLERYDLARRITRRLHAFQHPETGGAYAGHPDHRQDQRQDLFPTAQLGMTGLTTGDRALADGAFRWFKLLYESQPELPGRLYTAMEGSDLMSAPAGDPELEWQVITDFSRPRQAFYKPRHCRSLPRSLPPGHWERPGVEPCQGVSQPHGYRTATTIRPPRVCASLQVRVGLVGTTRSNGR